MKKFLGFTPEQASKMLQQKGLKANSREGAEYLAGMHKRAEDMLDEKGFQYGGQVGGFDNKSSKLFDAAVKRTASTEPKSPEVQRYLDNVIETRGNPTMVYPTTADPLMGYMSGGLSTANADMQALMNDNSIKRNLLVERAKQNINFGADKKTFDLIEKIPFLGRIAEDYYLKVLANELDNSLGRQDMPYSNRLLMAGKNPEADNELYKELLSFADERFPVGVQEPKSQQPLYRERMEDEVTRKNKELMEQERKAEEDRLYDQSTKEIERQRELERQQFNESRRQDFMERQGKPEFQEGGLASSLSSAPMNPAFDAFIRSKGKDFNLFDPNRTPEQNRALFKEQQEFMKNYVLTDEDKRNLAKPTALVPDDIAIGQPVPDKDPNVVTPFPTTGATGTAPRDKQRDNLNKAQADLAASQQKLSDLQQQLAKLPTDASQDAKRQELVNQITAQGTTITQNEAAVASASQAFQVAAVPTTAEAVGTAVSTPSDIATRQQVNLIGETPQQLIPTGTGQLDPTLGLFQREATAGQADATLKPIRIEPDATQVAQDIRDQNIIKTTGNLSQDAIANAQTIEQRELAIRDVAAAQADESVQVISPAKRKLEQGETFSGVANAEVARQFLEGVEAATGAPSSQATVQGQLTGLMQQFEGGQPPAWAAGAMRQATAVMAQRGLAASSMAGQAIVQAAMESALPIAMQDAKTVAQFEAQNISNRQQRAILAAQQRAQFLGMEFDQAFQARVAKAATISDIANRNFSSEVQIALENSRLAQTTNLTNLGNRQAVVMAQAAAIAEADMTNLNNRQQAEVRNAQSFLQMDMANFNAEQQADMFTNQSIVQGLFTDAAANNAMKQFNATSRDQTDQFFAKLETGVSEFNASQRTAMEQFNAGEANALSKFSQELNNQRDQFNARNELVIAQSNAQWRQQLTTINNAAQNEANRQDALQANALTQKGLDEIWQRERDLMAYAFTSAENAAQRRLELVKAELNVEAGEDTAFSTALGSFAGAVVNGIFDVAAAKAMPRSIIRV